MESIVPPAISDLYWLVLQPSSFVLLLLVLSLLLLMFRRYASGRTLLFGALVLAALPAIFPLRDALTLPLEEHVPRAALPEHIDGIIVLGGAVDWRVTQARQQLAMDDTGERMLAGAALARRYPQARLVLTGIFAEYLTGEFRPQAQGSAFFAGPEYPPGRVHYIGQARSTYEDALLGLQTLEPRQGETWLLVTSAMHMPRALGVFQTLGWNVVPYPVDYTTTGRLEFRPTLDVLASLVALDRVIREWGALMIYQTTGRTQSLFPRVP